MEPLELHKIGTGIFNAFHELQGSPSSEIFLEKRRILEEGQRFRLWSHSLGLHQQGHASLDYRVRDAVTVKDHLASILTGLYEHLENLSCLARGLRRPFEQERPCEDDIGSTGNEYESSSSEEDTLSNASSFHEVDFRLRSVIESLDVLYSLATKIRNPRNRPQRTIDQLYKHIPTEMRSDHILEREQVETNIIAYIQRQDIIENLHDSDFDTIEASMDEILAEYASPTNWLIRRTGVANARRKQQFIYWKEHAIRLSKTEETPPQALPARDDTHQGVRQEIQPTSAVASKPVVASLATSATRLSAQQLKPDDLKSVISRHSGVSVVIGPQGKELNWPPPPSLDVSAGYFFCPYCKALCPERYLSGDAWKAHLIHDLQPYHCTYEYCQDPNRLYGARQEWINHESQHTRVWHCQQHGIEFETNPEYLDHVRKEHPERHADHLSDELINAVVGPSDVPQRDCPFCPTVFSDVLQMQKHVSFHLERLALIALPPDSTLDDDECSVQSGDSHQPIMRGRRLSLVHDFVLEKDICQISCHVLNIGDWAHVKSNVHDLIVFYSKTHSTMTYYLSTDQAEYKIEYDLRSIEDMETDTSVVTLTLNSFPKFSTRRKDNPGNFYECGDFTEHSEASHNLTHSLYSQEKALPIQIEKFRRCLQLMYRDQPVSMPAFPENGQTDTYEHTDSISNILERRYLSEDKIDVDMWLASSINDRVSSDIEIPFAAYGMPMEKDYLDVSSIGNPDTWLDSDEFSLAEQLSSLLCTSQPLAQSGNNSFIVPSQDFSKEVNPYQSRGLTPSCAFCHAPGLIHCNCESTYLEHEVDRAEQRVFKPVTLGIREWVRSRAERHVLKEFRSRVEDISLDEILQKEYSRVWAEWYGHCPNLMEYFFAIVDIGLPEDDAEVMRNPQLALAIPADQETGENELEISESEYNTE